MAVIDEDGQSLEPDDYWTEQEGDPFPLYTVADTDGDDVSTVNPKSEIGIQGIAGDGADTIDIGIGTDVSMPEYFTDTNLFDHTDNVDLDTGSDELTLHIEESPKYPPTARGLRFDQS